LVKRDFADIKAVDIHNAAAHIEKSSGGVPSGNRANIYFVSVPSFATEYPPKWLLAVAKCIFEGNATPHDDDVLQLTQQFNIALAVDVLRKLGFAVREERTEVEVASLTKEQKIAAIESFLLDIDCLNRLNNYYNPVNFFEASGMVSKEVKHSRVLSWILNANAPHGLSDSIIRPLLQRIAKENRIISGTGIIDISLFDYSSFIVKNEWNDIDVLLVSDKEQAVIVIENKVYAGERKSGEDGGQLNKYRQIVEYQYKHFKHKMYIFLTREGEMPSDTDNWAIADYSMVIDTIKEVLATADFVNSDAKTILNHYISMVRRHLIMDIELQELCKKIYAKHKTALDIIYDNRPDTVMEISDFIKNVLAEMARDRKIDIDVDNNTKSCIRFTTPFIERILPRTDERDYGWNNGFRFMYEIKVGTYGVYGDGVVGKNDEEICSEIFEFAKTNKKISGVSKKASTIIRLWEIVYRKPLLSAEEISSWGDEGNKEKLRAKLIAFIDALASFEKELAKYLKGNV